MEDRPKKPVKELAVLSSVVPKLSSNGVRAVLLHPSREASTLLAQPLPSDNVHVPKQHQVLCLVL